MPVYEEYVRDRHEKVSDVCGDAEQHLIVALDNGESIAAMVADVAFAQAVAAWWQAAVNAIDQEGLDAVDALARTRKAAGRVLTDQPIPYPGCVFAHGFALARIEAARTFYHDTAHLDEITARRAS